MMKTKRAKKKNKKPRKLSEKIHLRVKVSPRLQWVIPYLKKAKSRMPGLILPTQIRSFKPTRKRRMRVLGNVYFETKIIVLATHTQQTEKTKTGRLRIKKIVAIPRTDILDTLAHELAHMRYPEHNYEHEEHTRTVFKTFGLTQKCPTCKGLGRIPMESKP